jgi:hypothetical protein
VAENVGLVTLPVLRFVDSAGAPLAFAKLYAFESGTSTPKPLYTSPAGTTMHPHPAVADGAGQLVAYAITDEAYTLDLFDENDVHQDDWPIDTYTVISNASGSWTPRVDGSVTPGTGTYVNRTGLFHRVGNLVTFTSYIEMSNHTGVGDLLVKGLPFPVTFGGALTCMFYVTGGVTFDGPIVAFLRDIADQVELYTNVLADGTINPIDLPALIADADVVTIILNGTYRTG